MFATTLQGDPERLVWEARDIVAHKCCSTTSQRAASNSDFCAHPTVEKPGKFYHRPRSGARATKSED